MTNDNVSKLLQENKALKEKIETMQDDLIRIRRDRDDKEREIEEIKDNLRRNKMPEFTVYCVSVYRNKKDSTKYMTSPHTLSGDDISNRIESIVTVEARSWSQEWELVSFSQAFLPFQVTYQI